MNSRTPPRRAFTLVEFCVVIAIIAILALILTPVLINARVKAHQTTCASNMRQISIGILQYAQDYNGLMVPRSMQGKDWTQIMQPYFHDQSIFQCPANPRSKEKYCCQSSGYAGYAASFQGGFRDVNSLYPPLKTSEYKSPGQTIIVLEASSRYSNFNIDAICPGVDCSQPEVGKEPGCLFMGHRNMTNYLFMDGHVKAMKPFETLHKDDGGTGTVNLWRYDNDTFTHWQQLEARKGTGPAEPSPTRPVQLINICLNVKPL